MPFEMCIFSTLEYASNKYHLLEHLQMLKGCKNNQITWDAYENYRNWMVWW